MRALTLTAPRGIDALEVGDVPEPVIAHADEVRIRVAAAAINRLDLMLTGGLPGVSLVLPHIVGTDAAGTVESVGPGVTAFAPGDRVMVNPGISCGRCDACLSATASGSSGSTAQGPPPSSSSCRRRMSPACPTGWVGRRPRRSRWRR